MDRDRRILDAAAEAFFEQGYHGVGVDGIGTRAGLSGPAIYRHFASKDEILATLLGEAMDELMSATLSRSGDAEADLDRALRHHVAFAVRHRHLVSLYQREVRSLAEPSGSAFRVRRAEYTRQWEDLFAHRFPDADAQTVAAASQACLGMIFSVSYWPERMISTARVEQLILDLLRGGIDGFSPGVDLAGGSNPPRNPRFTTGAW